MQGAAPGPTKVIFAGTYTDLADFEAFAARAKQSGATHIDITQSLPWSFWEYDRPDDPYPAWVISKLGLLKLTRPEAVRPHVPAAHAERVMAILEERGKVLKKLGLKALFNCSEPAMLPEAVFAAHPLWRGARVDHPARSRVARFAPSIDHPDVLALYRDAMATLLRRCPEIEVVDILTNDSGSGLDWSTGLYSGSFGNSLYRGRPMEDRVRGFFDALLAGAKDSGVALEVRIKNTREPDPRRIAGKLDRGTAIENLEGPEGGAFLASAGSGEGYGNTFYPVLGIPRVAEFLDDLMEAGRADASRLAVTVSDRRNRELFFSVYDAFRRNPVHDPVGRLTLLRGIAKSRVGDNQADDLLALWLNVEDVSERVKLFDTGGYLYNLGCVQQRWLTRPFVPFPGEISAEDKAAYRRFQFQAMDEAHAESMSDVQATDVYGGWSGRHFVNRVSDQIESLVAAATRRAHRIGDDDLARRFEIFQCVVRNARHAVSYQAQLDRVRRLGIAPDPSPVAGTQPGWDRQLMMETARAEIDNTAQLMQLLGDRPADYLLMAEKPEEEDIRRLGPGIQIRLQRKLDLMNAHWEDYKRLFTTPNL
jgi:hypothetical protein